MCVVLNSGHYHVQAVYNHWTGLVDWTGGLIFKVSKKPA